MKTVREGVIDALLDLGKDEKFYVLDADLSRATGTIEFQQKYPSRFLNMGVAEQDLVTMASGISATGKIPFISSFASFLTGNAYSQIRLAAGYSKIPLKLLGFNAGIASGMDGKTHHAIDDIALMLNIHDLVILQPGDYLEAYRGISEMSKMKMPSYMRISYLDSKMDCLQNFESPIRKFYFGGSKLREGNDITIVTSGPLRSIIIQVDAKLRKRGYSSDIIDIMAIRPLDMDIIIDSIRNTKRLICVEDHNIFGGLGSYIERYLSEYYPVYTKKIGIDEYGFSGTIEQLYRNYGLNSEIIYEIALIMIECDMKNYNNDIKKIEETNNKYKDKK